ncbi:MAG: polysaccharide deacetylase family protein [Proteobacteria bacterium]|nr:polysaccharide deacetylase family protein [Pseudomonadota bacterium]
MKNRDKMQNCASYYLGMLIVIIALISGCTTPAAHVSRSFEQPPGAKERVFPGFTAVIVREGDTLSSLAGQYLNDPAMGWLIADFNGIGSITPGMEIIIPLKPYERGGLTYRGYQTVPILSYHNFSPDKTDKMTVSKASFEDQMQLLKERGYRVITLDQLFDFFDFKKQIPSKSVVITIDDGWKSVYEIALPVLKKHGYPATLFVYTDLINTGRKAITWEQAKELADNGIDIQCHTITHRDLAGVQEKESFKEYFDSVEKEIVQSSNIIKKNTGRACRYLAYPFGNSNNLIVAILKRNGFRGAFTVRRGSSPFFINNYMVNRSMIYGEYDLKKFEKALNVFDDRAVK